MRKFILSVAAALAVAAALYPGPVLSLNIHPSGFLQPAVGRETAGPSFMQHGAGGGLKRGREGGGDSDGEGDDKRSRLGPDEPGPSSAAASTSGGGGRAEAVRREMQRRVDQGKGRSQQELKEAMHRELLQRFAGGSQGSASGRIQPDPERARRAQQIMQQRVDRGIGKTPEQMRAEVHSELKERFAQGGPGLRPVGPRQPSAVSTELMKGFLSLYKRPH
ncbi:hypothetical protein Efla_000984 [Eimeria flavescens]